MMDSTREINSRYSQLAASACCLSCGGAVRYAEPQPGETCVDLGSGRGTDCIRLAEQVGPGGRVYGIDIADGMLEKARALAAEKGITTIEFLKSPIEVIPLPGRSANLVISNCTINHARNKSAVWAEVFRVLERGGRFVVSDIYSLEPVPEEFSTDPVAVSECWAGAVTKETYFNLLKQSGFINIAILEESTPYSKGSITVASFTISGYKPQ